MPSYKSNSFYLFLLMIFSVVFFIPFLGNTHLFDWDEINFAEISREMVITGNYQHPQINYQLFTEKPPFFFWMQAISMKIFGINEYAARFPNALLGLMVLPVLFMIGQKLKDRLFGLIWAISFGCAILPHLYFKSGIIDPYFNFFIFLSLYFLIAANSKKGEERNNRMQLVYAGIFAGLAILTKGPAAVIILGLTGCIFLFQNRFKNFFSLPELMIVASALLITAGLWLGIDFLQNGSHFIKAFTIRQWELFSSKDAGHGGFFLYHFIVLLFGCFPISVFFIKGLMQPAEKEEPFSDFMKWMKILFWVVLILFSVVQTKIVHYSSLCYYPLSFIAGIGIYHLIVSGEKIKTREKILLWLTALPFVIAPFIIVYASNHMDLLRSLLSKDPFAVENLNAAVQWTGFEAIPGLGLLIAFILSIYFFNKKENKKALVLLFAGSLFFIQSGLYFLINRIETYSQRANIEFWQQHAKEDCYKMTYRYKSYTQYFYGAMMPQKNAGYTNEEWLLKGKIDKPVYISCKVNHHADFEENVKDAKLLYSKNGFYFYSRSPLP